MNLTAKAAVFALIALMTFQTTITSAYADDRNNGNQFEGDEREDDDDERKKPKFQTKFFSEE